jgi:hypothetical protein
MGQSSCFVNKPAAVGAVTHAVAVVPTSPRKLPEKGLVRKMVIVCEEFERRSWGTSPKYI